MCSCAVRVKLHASFIVCVCPSPVSRALRNSFIFVWNLIDSHHEARHKSLARVLRVYMCRFGNVCDAIGQIRCASAGFVVTWCEFMNFADTGFRFLWFCNAVGVACACTRTAGVTSLTAVMTRWGLKNLQCCNLSKPCYLNKNNKNYSAFLFLGIELIINIHVLCSWIIYLYAEMRGVNNGIKAQHWQQL